jgi:hypothetical protein
LAVASWSAPALAGPVCQTTVPIALPTGLPALSIKLTDVDGDGLDDQAEDELASCAMPLYHFDSAEPARQSFEPVMLHSVYPDGFSAGGLPKVTVRFAELYAEDGGFIYCATPQPNWCNDHIGDSQAQQLTLLVSGLTEATILDPDPDETGPATFSGTHLEIFASAGKHHAYLGQHVCPGGDLSSCYYSGGFGWEHRDRANGAGATRLPTSVNVGQDEESSFDVCGLPGTTPKGFVNDLGPLGFAGDFVYHPCDDWCGAGGDTCADGEDDWTSFRDDDSEVGSVHDRVVRAASPLTLFFDGSGSKCRYAETTAGADEDQDGIPDKCDACPDAADPDQDFPYQDFDGDGIADDCDNCPYVANDQWDSDGDGAGDVCDNCLIVANADQANHDDDEWGDACDADDDDDGCNDDIDDDDWNDEHVTGWFTSATCNPRSGLTFDFAGVDSDEDGQLDCADDDDDEDGVPDADDSCPIDYGTDRNLCWSYKDCPVQTWWDVCMQGGCEDYLLKAFSHVNPDPTILDVFAARDEALIVAVPDRIGASGLVDLLADARLELWDRGGSFVVEVADLVPESTRTKKGAPEATRVSVHPGEPTSEVAAEAER